MSYLRRLLQEGSSKTMSWMATAVLKDSKLHLALADQLKDGFQAAKKSPDAESADTVDGHVDSVMSELELCLKDFARSVATRRDQQAMRHLNALARSLNRVAWLLGMSEFYADGGSTQESVNEDDEADDAYREADSVDLGFVKSLIKGDSSAKRELARRGWKGSKLDALIRAVKNESKGIRVTLVTPGDSGVHPETVGEYDDMKAAMAAAKKAAGSGAKFVKKGEDTGYSGSNGMAWIAK